VQVNLGPWKVSGNNFALAYAIHSRAHGAQAWAHHGPITSNSSSRSTSLSLFCFSLHISHADTHRMYIYIYIYVYTNVYTGCTPAAADRLQKASHVNFFFTRALALRAVAWCDTFLLKRSNQTLIDDINGKRPLIVYSMTRPKMYDTTTGCQKRAPSRSYATSDDVLE
jgi:hypothetical protein